MAALVKVWTLHLGNDLKALCIGKSIDKSLHDWQHGHLWSSPIPEVEQPLSARNPAWTFHNASEM